MKMRSSEAKNSCSSSSPLRICSSLRSKPMVESTLWANTSLTVRNTGLLSSITQQLGDRLISQSEKAKRASMVLSDDTPGARCTSISTSAAVLSSILRAFIFPFSTALVMESISVAVFLL